MTSVIFVVPDVEIELSEEEVAPIANELAALGSTPLGSGAGRLQTRIQQGDRVEVQSIGFDEFWALLRALDHVRHASELGPQAHRLRDALVAGWIPYRLRPFTGGPELNFTSYGGMYLAADRLVRSPGEVYRVLDVVVQDDDPTVLVIGEWYESLAE